MSTLQNKLDKGPLVMGILNVTPDSFSDGGKFMDVDNAVDRALQMVEEGADIIDIGGESTGPGSNDVDVKEELERVIPVFEKLRHKTDVLLSVDTYKHQVALHALTVGADMVNDVTALRGDDEMAKSLAGHKCPVVLMYAKDETPRTTNEDVQYDDVVDSVKRLLKERIAVAEKAGIKRDRLIVDPGMGAFVSSEPFYSLQLLKRLKELESLDCPILVGASRKSFIGKTLDVPLHERLEGGLAAAAIAVWNGAAIIRAHDVKETRRVVDMVHAIQST
ncbi:dihydropteroate synthase [Candidatus Peregrinibacteria bacterium]|nr:dihydropteroate synthase [Candidatus Peregrinibacteria bacterium]